MNLAADADETALGPRDPGVAEQHDQDRDPAETFQIGPEPAVTRAWAVAAVLRAP